MLTTLQVAALADLTPRRIRQWCEAGSDGRGNGVYAQKIGRDWVIAACACPTCGGLVLLHPAGELDVYEGRCQRCVDGEEVEP